jgi:DmsE family decaheme c-type cytochrome
MKKLLTRISHTIFSLSLAGAIGFALSANRSLSAEMGASSMGQEKAEFVGAETCAACHQDEVEAFKGAKHGKALLKSKGVEFTQSCETCHGAGSLHSNAGGDKAAPGFASLTIFKKLTPTEVSNACLECHKDSERSHWSGGPHDRANVSCTACHSVHNAKGHGELVKKNTSETCYQCHKNVKGEMRRSAHMPVEEGKMDCSSCHDMHGTSTPKQLKAANTNQLCFQCHQDKRGPHLWEHAPVRENCLTCHHPHGSHYDKMLIAKQPFLCQRCHSYAHHPGAILDAENATKQRAQIFGQSCYECHANIHGSNHPSGKYLAR